MDAVLKKLLATEQQAEQQVADAQAEHTAVIAAAQGEAQAIEDAFEQTTSAIKASHIDKAQARAEQAVAESKRRNDERDRQLRDAAAAHRQAALRAALELFAPGGTD